ncbi:MAG: ABC transporter permease [Pseudomonadota bacterium]|uniref:ABC transporter permease n=1 Tax=Polaromonas sp. TaxID=1869339 RepID=UPI0017D0F384|nr:ABC transporter permease [Polaromonas sp.]MBA3594981.1 ABC transporter permease [Polaromonas sp.]MDQ3273135.1 ABC transporter permease [Pseudomonadota bacterium]
MLSRLASLALFVALVAGWEFLARDDSVSALVLPAPLVIWDTLWNGLRSGYFWPHLIHTGTELLLGLALGCAAGFFGGIAMAESVFLRRLLFPYVLVSQVVPKLALAPLFIVWFGFGMTSTVVITALICFFPLMENTLTGLQQVEPRKLELFRMLGATRAQTLWQLKIPSGLPVILAGFRVAVVLALVGAVVGEFIGGSKGLGALIIASQGMMDTPLMFAVLLLITVLGVVIYQLALGLERLLLWPHFKENSKD